MQKKGGIIYLSFCAIFAIMFSLTAQRAIAALCPTGGSVTLTIGDNNCEINDVANYTDLTIPSGVTITSALGKKMEITATGTVTINGNIDVSGKGNDPRGKGKDSTGNGTIFNTCTNAYAGGGGGGGHGAVGGEGGTDVSASGGAGGGAYNDSMALGSQGGSGGGDNDPLFTSHSPIGGFGGGAVIIKAQKVILNGNIYANGSNGEDDYSNNCTCADGISSGGGGSGGSVNINTIIFEFNGKIKANGGDGGNDYNTQGWDGTGGGGGGGIVFIYYAEMTGNGTIIETKGGMAGKGACTAYIPGASGSGSEGVVINPCTLGLQDCVDRCIDKTTREYDGKCDKKTGKCVYNNSESCIDTDPCTIDECKGGSCLDTNFCGGLVPCGRMIDNPNTVINETNQCDICHLFYLIDLVLDFIISFAGITAILSLILVGYAFITSAGDTQKRQNAKNKLKWVLAGFMIVFLAWLIVDFFFSVWGFMDPLGGKWNVVCD